MSDGLDTIGAPARRTGLPVRTIRFWSDSGVLPPTGRSAGGYRLNDEAALTRLDLVRMLREPGTGLEAVQEILARRVTVAELARVRVRAEDAEVRALLARRAVLHLISERGATDEETLMLHRLAQWSAAERREIVTEFVSGTFAGIPLDGDAEIIAGWMRELPDSPSPAPAAGVASGSAEAGRVLDRVVGVRVGDRGPASPRNDLRSRPSRTSPRPSRHHRVRSAAFAVGTCREQPSPGLHGQREDERR
ncbi:MerR family transcriptional regulator [Nonomuraea sp. NPDC050643]|uniref:helix-turn-helix domain-containing protein n=1 Tax=Nonomuraea sp. NPDC050643 TaxID=3155660 RepID=UPI0033DAAAB6